MSQNTPSASATPLSLTYSCVIPHPTDAQLLLLPHEVGWALPQWRHESDTIPYWQTVGGIGRELRARLGLTVPILRCIHVTHDPQRGRLEYLYETEPAPLAWTPPPGGRWFGRDDLARIPLDEPAQRALLDRWFADNDDATVLARRPPWYRPGWFADAASWLAAQLAWLGRPLIAPPEQLRSWERSCLLRVRTAGGWVYMKAVPAMFAHEPPLTDALARSFPGEIPILLARDDTRHRMVMADFGGVSLADVRDAERWAAALRRFAGIQIACIPRVALLRALGCPARPIETLLPALDDLLADLTAFPPDDPDGLSAAEIAALRILAPDLSRWCEALTRAAISETLEHGDFWAGNVATTPDGFLYFDWSDSALTHPFFSATLFLADAARAFPDDPTIVQRLRDAYLGPWNDYMPQEVLKRLFALAQRVAPLYHAITYHRDILPAMSAPWEMERMVPYYLRMLLVPQPES